MNIQVGDKVIVKNKRESFFVVVIEKSGNWIKGIGQGSHGDNSRVEEWFPISAPACRVFKANSIALEPVMISE